MQQFSLGHAGGGGGSGTGKLQVGGPVAGRIILRRRRPSCLAQVDPAPGSFGNLDGVI